MITHFMRFTALRTTLVSAGLALLTAPASVTAQASRAGPRVAPVMLPPAQATAYALSSLADTQQSKQEYHPTYWVEGGVFGAVYLGAVGYLFAEGFCEEGDCTLTGVAGAVLAAPLGFGMGALVGGLFPAPYPRPLEGHPAKGLLVGTLVGAFSTFALASQGCLGGCSDQEIGYDFLFTVITGTTGLLLGLGHPHEEQP